MLRDTQKNYKNNWTNESFSVYKLGPDQSKEPKE